MSSGFKKNLHLSNGHKGLDALNQGMETFTRILKRESGTMFKAPVPKEKGRREEASNMPLFANIHSYIEDFLPELNTWRWYCI
jgi:hypothetical protein